ncbi:hypothetical protein QFZ79_004385 [Arthrobacter sp. V4I6]|uniref:hypothetical protein n=1 Tax=unclassified Arthrobacter TaxID=235627 RepID=UPI0027849785|nr:MULTISPECIES: hypothetical protein [unclassified Arthrobacter]MDQ0822005.1 hypothetical protein [Arthrobacter sp. V1I7]MDQ0856274.1 hypothetical protein [Arthrobacter sp. V4I6]
MVPSTIPTGHPEPGLRGIGAGTGIKAKYDPRNLFHVIGVIRFIGAGQAPWTP